MGICRARLTNCPGALTNNLQEEDCSRGVTTPDIVTMLWINQLTKLHQLVTFIRVELQQHQKLLYTNTTARASKTKCVVSFS